MFSATDVANFLSCHHLLTLDRAEAAGEIRRPFFHDPGIDLLRELGIRHEQAYLDHLANAQDLEVAEIPVAVPREESVARTIQALRSGAGAIYQASFQNGPWHGRSDFLVRVQKPSALGSWSYEVVETKLARSTKAAALMQLCFYSDLLSEIQELQPDWMHVVLGQTSKPEKYRVEQYMAYFRKIKRDFNVACRTPGDTYPEPNEHCNVCSWDPLCDKRRRTDDYLSLVAGITRNQRKALVARDVTTVARLARLDLSAPPKIDGIGNAALMRIHEQARLQVQGRQEGHLVYELLENSEPDTGLAALPAPSPGDVFLDLEGDPYAFDHGLEYLIGVVTVPDEGRSEPSYEPLWSFDRAQEKRGFQKVHRKSNGTLGPTPRYAHLSLCFLRTDGSQATGGTACDLRRRGGPAAEGRHLCRSLPSHTARYQSFCRKLFHQKAGATLWIHASRRTEGLGYSASEVWSCAGVGRRSRGSTRASCFH